MAIVAGENEKDIEIKIRAMNEEKTEVDGKIIFLGIMFLLGGLTNILVLISRLKKDEIGLVILGIPLMMLGVTYLLTATECWRQKKREERKNKVEKI